MSGIPRIQKELKVKEIFFLSLGLYRKNFLRFLTIFILAEAASVPLDILIRMVFPIQYPSAAGFATLGPFTIEFAAIPQSLITVAVLSPITSISNGMGVSLAAEMVEEKSSGLRMSFESTIRSLREIWYLTLITGFVGVLSSALIILPLLFTTLFFMALPAVLVENKKALEGIGRSRKLLSRRWVEIFLLILIIGLIAGLPNMAIGYAVDFLSSLGMIVLGIETALLGPLFATASTVAFFSNAARLSSEETQSREIGAPKTNKLWICRNCRTSFVSSSMPSPTAFGACRGAKHSFFSVPKHVWVEAPSPTPTEVGPSEDPPI